VRQCATYYGSITTLTSEPDLSQQCELCGELNPKTLEEHHVVPQRFGGSDLPENLVTLCASCHAAVERIWDDDFYRRLQDKLGGLSVNASDESLGVEVTDGTLGDRRLPMESPHVRPETIGEENNVAEALFDLSLDHGERFRVYACGYCNRAFDPREQAELATHLQRKHGIENPYARRDERTHGELVNIDGSSTTQKLPEQVIETVEKERRDSGKWDLETGADRIVDIYELVAQPEQALGRVAEVTLDPVDEYELLTSEFGTENISEARRRYEVAFGWYMENKVRLIQTEPEGQNHDE